MVKYLGNPHSLFIITFIAFVVPCFCDPTDIISSCLIRHNVYNFTLLPHNGSQSPDYYRLLNFSLQNLRYAVPTAPKPVAIAIPQSLKQLVNSMRCCREGWYEFRVRCGGHSYEGISSVVPDGNPFVIIDMMSLNQVSVDVESETAWVEGEQHLVRRTMQLQRRAMCMDSQPGHAQLLVLAATLRGTGKPWEKMCFWAIRGGGGGVWGIVYAWKIKLLKVPETVTSCIMSRTGTKLHGGDEETGVSASFKGFYLGSRNEAMSILNRVFPELGVEKEDCREMSWIESILYFSGLPNGSSISDLRNRYLEDKLYFKAKSDYVRTPISMEGLVTALDILEMQPKGSVVLDPYGGEMEKISSDALPFLTEKATCSQFSIWWPGKKTALL
ncbi:Reticuline oxidase [Vitis vinifera]|uniref:Reticuline oxidase n=1 Tax=Vitis vinifera TaxID=29760 RepID=A0A438HGV0_VITVI|nr:Reticuline oxidase [Vitis vinifera]